jgi:hypothetical protein
MCRRNKSSYGPAFFAKTHFACFHIDTNTTPARQFIQITPGRKFDPFINRDRNGFPATSASYIQAGILKYISFTI